MCIGRQEAQAISDSVISRGTFRPHSQTSRQYPRLQLTPCSLNRPIKRLRTHTTAQVPLVSNSCRTPSPSRSSSTTAPAHKECSSHRIPEGSGIPIHSMSRLSHRQEEGMQSHQDSTHPSQTWPQRPSPSRQTTISRSTIRNRHRPSRLCLLQERGSIPASRTSHMEGRVLHRRVDLPTPTACPTTDLLLPLPSCPTCRPLRPRLTHLIPPLPRKEGCTAITKMTT